VPQAVYLLYLVKLVIYLGGGILLSSVTSDLGGLGEIGSTLPLMLIASSGGTIGKIAVIGMVIFHLHILSTFALAVPLESNIFMTFGVLFLFGHYGSVPISTLDDPLLIPLLLPLLIGLPVLGNFRPDLVSFLPSMRYYAGNWPTSQWYFQRATKSEAKLDEHLNKAAPIVPVQLAKFYEPETSEGLTPWFFGTFRPRGFNQVLQHAMTMPQSSDGTTVFRLPVSLS